MLSTNQSVGEIERLRKLPDLTMYCSTLSHGNSKFIISEKGFIRKFRDAIRVQDVECSNVLFETHNE